MIEAPVLKMMMARSARRAARRGKNFPEAPRRQRLRHGIEVCDAYTVGDQDRRPGIVVEGQCVLRRASAKLRAFVDFMAERLRADPVVTEWRTSLPLKLC